MRLTFEGVVSARSYAFARASVGDAVSDLRRDVARSLRSRLDTFLDEADDALEEEEAHGVTSHNALASIERALSTRDASGKEQSVPGALLTDAMRLVTNEDDASSTSSTVLTFALPRRAWARWLGGLSVCDYLAQGETEADVVARCAEVMRFEVSGGVKGVVLAEREAVSRRSGGGGGDGADAKRAKCGSARSRRGRRRRRPPERNRNRPPRTRRTRWVPAWRSSPRDWRTSRCPRRTSRRAWGSCASAPPRPRRGRCRRLRERQNAVKPSK